MARLEILIEKRLKLKSSGNEVYYTNSSMLLVKNMLCGKFCCHKGSNLILFSYKIRAELNCASAPSQTAFVLGNASSGMALDSRLYSLTPHPRVQGYLAHTKLPTPLGLP